MSPRFSSLAAVAAAGTVALSMTAAQALASSPRAAGPAAPVIHESFSPLPCSGSPGHRSTLQLEGCAEQRILRGDKQIDSLNRRIFSALPSTSARRDLIAGHRAWLSYRRAYCLSASDAFAGGTAAGVVAADCTATLNVQHASNLKTFLRDLTSTG